MEVVAHARQRLVVGEPGQLTRRGTDLLPELVGTPDAFALPERDGAGQAGRRRDEHAIARDLLDPPRRRTEQERLTRARLVHHLLVELADAPSAVDEEHAEEAAVGDRARIRDGEPPRAVACADRAVRAVPDDPRAQLGELVGRVAPGEHVEDVVELRAAQVAERICPSDERVDLVTSDFGVNRNCDDLLRQHIQRIHRDARLLDLAFAHRAGDHSAFEQIRAELREDAALRDRTQLMARAPDALQAARNRLRRLDLDHEIDRSHVDPELEARRGDEARNPARLQILFDQNALLTCERAVMRARDLVPRPVVALVRELVEAQRQPLRETAVVDEHDRRAVRLHEPQELWIDGRPDRLRAELRPSVHLLSVSRNGVGQRRGRAELAHVLDRDDHFQVELLAGAGVDDRDRPAAGDELADLLDRPLGSRQTNALQRPSH